MSGTKTHSAAGVGSPFPRASLAAEDLFPLTRPQRRRSGGRAGRGEQEACQTRRGWRVACCRGRACFRSMRAPAWPEHSMERLTFSGSRLHGGGHLAASGRDPTAPAGCVAGWRWTCPRFGEALHPITRCNILRRSVAGGTAPAGGLRSRSAAGSGGAVWCICYLMSCRAGPVTDRRRAGVPSDREGRVSCFSGHLNYRPDPFCLSTVRSRCLAFLHWCILSAGDEAGSEDNQIFRAFIAEQLY